VFAGTVGGSPKSSLSLLLSNDNQVEVEAFSHKAAGEDRLFKHPLIGQYSRRRRTGKMARVHFQEQFNAARRIVPLLNSTIAAPPATGQKFADAVFADQDEMMQDVSTGERGCCAAIFGSSRATASSGVSYGGSAH